MEDGYEPSDQSSNDYAFSGKIMLSAMVILFFVILLFVVLHIYARWYLLRLRRRQIIRRARHRVNNIVFYVDPTGTLNRGLDPAVIQALPVFSYSSKTRLDSLECAVCLSEFEENESARMLPKCNHSFHIDCIDMWFHSHSTCPLCRSPVEIETVENSGDVVISIDEPVAGIGTESGSEMCMDCMHEEDVGTSSSTRSRRKPLDVSIEVPKRNEEELRRAIDSPAYRSPVYRSPMSRMLSFKRIISRDRDRKGNVSPSSGSATESDIETRQTRSELGGTE